MAMQNSTACVLLRSSPCGCCAGGIAGLLNNVPEFTLPELPEGMRPSSGMRSATFNVLFLDEVRESCKLRVLCLDIHGSAIKLLLVFGVHGLCVWLVAV